ncbi:MAG: PAS domain S-box protein [Gammaproteobacteria bacterium]|nr:MAG: PAS domain S-box protein [Gammaproteobacteria bacterium]
MDSMSQSSWSAANEISNYVEMMQKNIAMFADIETKMLEDAQLSKSSESIAIGLLNQQINSNYPDAINFLIWNRDGKLVIDAKGTQINKPEVYVLPSISGVDAEYAVRMHRNSDQDHFNIIVPWKYENNFMGIFGVSFPSELVQPLLYKHQNINYQLVLWRQDSPGFVELAAPNSDLDLVNDVYLEPEDMQRVGAVASIGGTQWDVVSLHNHTLFSDELRKIVVSSLLKFLAILIVVIIAAKLYQRETRRRYEANEKIRKTQERLQLALESTQDGVWEIDLGRDENFFDERWCELVGYASEELQNGKQPRNRMIHEDDIASAKQSFDLHLSGDADFYEHEHRIKHKSGNWIWVHDRGRILDRDENGTPLRVIGTTADITERKHAELALKKNDEALHFFYSIVSVEGSSLHTQIQCLLAGGCKHLGMKCGIFSYIEGERYTVMQVHTESPTYQVQGGDKFELGLTYCQLTIESRDALGFAHAKTTEVAHHPAYAALKLEAYIGAAVYLDNNPYGTLNFTSLQPRANEFNDTEKKFVQMMSEWISNKLQSQFAEQRQKEADQTLALHLENSPTAIVEWDENGVIERWSHQAEQILGWSDEEVVGKMPSNWSVKHPSHPEMLIELQTYMQNRNATSNQFGLTIQDASGKLKHTEWAATQSSDLFNVKVSYMALVHDVTERVEMQQNLLRSQTRLQDLYENAPDMYFSVDANGTIQSVNQFCADYLGYTKDELLNKPIWNLMHENDIRRANRHFNVVFEDQINEFEMEIRMLTREGVLINTHHRLRVIEAQKGVPRELRILCRDVTQRSTSQRERLDHIKVQRDEVSREMRHRIKNNLQAIVGLLKVNLDAYPELRNVLVTSINQVDTISIVNNLMIDSAHRLVNVVELIKQITQASSKLFSQEVSFEVLCDDSDHLEFWEEETVAVSLIISELITNAMKHRSSYAVDSDGVRIIIDNEESKLIIQVANKINYAAGEFFSFEESLNSGGVGMGMIQSLMPPEGAELEYEQEGDYVKATLTLHPPVILNMYASEMNVLEAVS